MVANPEHRGNLKALAFDCYPARASNVHEFQDAIKSPKLGFWTFSFFSNLQVLKGDDKWMTRKKRRSNVQIPSGNAEFLELKPFGSLMMGFEEIGQYGLSLASVNMGPSDDLWWPI